MHAPAKPIRFVGLLIEFGLIVPQGIRQVYERVPGLIEDAGNELPGRFRLLIDRLLQHLRELDRHVVELERDIEQWHRSSEVSRRLETIPGIGPSPQARWWPALAIRRTSRTRASSQRGSGWCRIRTPAAARRSCWGSASAAMFTFEHC